MSGRFREGLAWGIEGTFPGLVFGVDEVGRGPWAGPVMAAAVCLNPACVPDGLADSKQVPAARRAHIAAQLEHVAVAQASVAEIDSLNIRAASLLAMARAVAVLAARLGAPTMVLVDGNVLPKLDFPARAIVCGDAQVACIAAASIAAKVTRDRLMAELCAAHPGFGWVRNKGYGTAEHAAGLQKHGPTAQHRRTFRPIAKLIG